LDLPLPGRKLLLHQPFVELILLRLAMGVTLRPAWYRRSRESTRVHAGV